MQISVSGVKHVAAGDVVGAGDLFDPAQRLGKAGPRHGAVIDQVVGGEAGDGAESAAAALPEPGAFFLV